MIVVSLLTLGACSEPIDFDPGQIEPYAVLLSRPMNDSTVCVYLTYSRFFLDNRQPASISDATVTLEVNGTASVGTYDADAYMDYGGYTFAVLPQPGDTLKVTASIPGYGKTVKATTSIPPMPEIEVLDYVIDTGKGVTENEYYYYRDYYYYKIRFKVKCHSNDEYYLVSIKYADTKCVDSVWAWDTANWARTYFTVSDPLVNTSNLEDAIDGYDGSFYGDEMLFSSELFQNGEHEFTAIASYWPNFADCDYAELPLRLDVKTLSRELYRYEKTAGNASYDYFETLFSEPVQVMCNIKGGIGIFGGSCCKKFNLPEPRYESFTHSDNYYFKKK